MLTTRSFIPSFGRDPSSRGNLPSATAVMFELSEDKEPCRTSSAQILHLLKDAEPRIQAFQQMLNQAEESSLGDIVYQAAELHCVWRNIQDILEIDLDRNILEKVFDHQHESHSALLCLLSASALSFWHQEGRGDHSHFIFDTFFAAEQLGIHFSDLQAACEKAAKIFSQEESLSQEISTTCTLLAEYARGLCEMKAWQNMRGPIWKRS